MPLNASKKRPLNRVLWLVVIAVFILHGLATWALLHLQMPDPKPIVLKLTAPIEIELITLPSSLTASNDMARTESGATADSQPATSSSMSNANNRSQNNSSQNNSKPPQPQPSSAQSRTSASVTKSPSNRSPTEGTTQANNNASSKGVVNNVNQNKSLATKPTSTTQRATNTATQSTTSATTRTKPATSSQAATNSTSNASQSAIAATSQIETQTTIVARPGNSHSVTGNAVSNNAVASGSAVSQSTTPQQSQGQQSTKASESKSQTAGEDKGKGTGAGKTNDKEDTTSVSSVATGPFVFAESEAKWRREPNLNSFKQNLFREHDESTIRVRVSIEVNEKGRPTKVQVESGPLKARLANQLKRDLLSGEFVPFTRGGRAVAGTVKLPLRFVRAG